MSVKTKFDKIMRKSVGNCPLDSVEFDNIIITSRNVARSFYLQKTIFMQIYVAKRPPG